VLTMASSTSVVLLALLFNLAQVLQGVNIPTPQSLCGLVVDNVVQRTCLKCFADAGKVQENPVDFRKCVGKYLPPILAECSVPDTNNIGGWRINQKPPPVHHNHTNANVLPTCLTRRMRVMSRYLAKELRFTKQAGGIMKKVVGSRLVDHGGPTMLSIKDLTAILALPAVQKLVKGSPGVETCYTTYPAPTTRRLTHTRALRALMHAHKELEERDDDEEQEEDEVKYQFDLEIPSGTTRSAGNDIPFGGTNSLARASLLGTCIISALVDNGKGKELLDIVSQDTFFYPIPQWWVRMLLKVAKKVIF